MTDGDAPRVPVAVVVPAGAPREPAPLAPLAGALRLALRAWGRYVAPLTLLALVALAPLAYVALRAPVPVDAAHAHATVILMYELAAAAWIFQLVLVGGAAPAVAALAHDAPLSQWRALRGGAAQLVRAILPCLAAAAAVLVGGLALAVPGLLLLALFSLAGAATAPGISGPLAASAAAARPQLAAAAIVVAAMLALDVGLAFAAQRGLFWGPFPKSPSPAQLALARHAIRATAAALVALSPLPAAALAALHARRAA